MTHSGTFPDNTLGYDYYVSLCTCTAERRELFKIPLICLPLCWSKIHRQKCGIRRILSPFILMFKDDHGLLLEMVIALLINLISLEQPNWMWEWNIWGSVWVWGRGLCWMVRKRKTPSLLFWLWDSFNCRLHFHIPHFRSTCSHTLTP